jgi:hypothetical protein
MAGICIFTIFLAFLKRLTIAKILATIIGLSLPIVIFGLLPLNQTVFLFAILGIIVFVAKPYLFSKPDMQRNFSKREDD